LEAASPDAASSDTAELRLLEPNPCQGGAPQPGDFVPGRRADERGECWANDAAERSVRTELVRALGQPALPERVEVTFACDDLVDRVETMVFVEADARTVVWLMLRAPDDGFTITGFEPRRRDLAEGPVKRSSISKSEADALLPRLRALIAARVRFVRPKPKDWFSSGSGALGGDQTYWLQLIDRHGRTANRHFVGGTSSGNRPERAPAEAMRDELVPVLDRASETAGGLTAAESKSLARWTFANRSEDDLATNVALVAHQRQFIPTLLESIRVAPSTAKDVEGHDVELRVLAELTGWDARRRLDGGSRTRNETINAYWRQCAPLWKMEFWGGNLPAMP